jgi:hypothetical protein
MTIWAYDDLAQCCGYDLSGLVDPMQLTPDWLRGRSRSAAGLTRRHRSEDFAMQRLKSMGKPPLPRPAGSWLAGLVISTAIMTIAGQAMLLGAGAAIRDATLKGD